MTFFNNQDKIISLLFNSRFRDMDALAKLISGLFITYSDFEMYMMEHADDFCYWIDESLLSQSNFQSLDIDNTNLISAMFIREIGLNRTHGLTWTSWRKTNDENGRQRILELKGNDYLK